MEAFSLAMAKWEEAETALLQKLVYAGVSEEKAQKVSRRAVTGGGAYSFAACLSRLALDHASLSRRSTHGGGGDAVWYDCCCGRRLCG